MKCVYEWFARFREGREDNPPGAEDRRSPLVTKTLRKRGMKKKRVIDIDHIPNIQRNVTSLLNTILKEDFLQSFQDFFQSFQYSRSQGCIVVGGDYFKGK
ncbi:hypothetical protein TNCV_3003671 [Trichonephila clavipes]|nr:hypothetical protein TNCV_3003671 [Trichonephila clavipes]